jgi:hypothetical protein
MHPLASAEPKEPTAIDATQVNTSICLMTDLQQHVGEPIAAEMVRSQRRVLLRHDPEECAAVFRKDHARAKSYSAMTIRPNLIAF